MAMRVLPWLILPLLASCVAPNAPAPTPAPRPSAAPAGPAAAPAIAPERYAGDWSTADATPGDWAYTASGNNSLARFTSPSNGLLAELRCSGETLTLVRNATIDADGNAMINVRSSFAERRLPSPLRGAGLITASLPASDPLWDQIIYSRGRFLIESTRQAPIIVPNRAEVARVIEDCRS
jgi:hypothetical protein